MNPSLFSEALQTPLWEILALLVGLIVGSFANVCIHRLPRRESVVRPRSRCPGCGKPIRAMDNVPVLSYLVLRGRCRSCSAPISPRYPLVEAANGLAWAGLAALRGPQASTVVLMVFVTALLVLSLIDLDHQILPNAITLPGIALGLLASLLPGPPTPLQSLVSAAAGYAAFAAVAFGYRATRGIEGLGQGDWKMAAMLGAFLGWEKMLLTIFVASLGGTLVGMFMMMARGHGSRHALPLGTFLGFAGIAVVFLGDPVVAWYRGLLVT